MYLDIIISLLKIFIVTSIFFVWVVRYQNIVKEFGEYNFPNWFRDIMGIIKLSACLMILNGNPYLIIFSATILASLMLAAFFIHIRSKHTLLQMAPSFSLMCASFILGLYSFNSIQIIS